MSVENHRLRKGANNGVAKFASINEGPYEAVDSQKDSVKNRLWHQS